MVVSQKDLGNIYIKIKEGSIFHILIISYKKCEQIVLFVNGMGKGN